ncbi:MAG: alpha/beta fold hydrolase, partial [Candidatus Promineifilaceae bacterium]
MAEQGFEQLYAGVPEAQSVQLLDFRASHAYKEIKVNRKVWRYIAAGRGETAVVFLPGAFLPADMWFYQVTALVDGYRVLAPDAYALQGIFDLDQVCWLLEEMLVAEGFEEATFVGLSAGAGLIQYLLQERPGLVTNAVLSHCGPIIYDEKGARQGRLLLTLSRFLPTSIIRRILLRETGGTTPADSQWGAFHEAYFQEQAAKLNKEMFLRFMKLGMETRRDFIFEADEIEAWPGRMLILTSEDDDFSYPRLDILQERYRRAETHVFEAGGHHTYIYFPEAYTEVLKGFLAGKRVGTGET